MRSLDAAARASGRGEPGHTVVIHGVPGAGKTALLNEYVARLLDGGGQTGNPTIAVPLRPGDLDAPPVAFSNEQDGWTPVADVKRALMAADDFGDPVDGATATRIIKELCANGYVERYARACRPVLPSLSSHFETIRRGDYKP